MNFVDPTGLVGCGAQHRTCAPEKPLSENEAAEARHNSIINTGYDPDLGHYRGEVEIEHITDGYSVTRTLNNPTEEELSTAIQSTLTAEDFVAQRGGRPPRRGSGRGSWVLERNGRGRTQWRFRPGGVSPRDAFGRAPAAPQPIPGIVYNKHHLFPQQFRSQFEKAGINIDRVTALMPIMFTVNSTRSGTEIGPTSSKGTPKPRKGISTVLQWI